MYFLCQMGNACDCFAKDFEHLARHQGKTWCISSSKSQQITPEYGKSSLAMRSILRCHSSMFFADLASNTAPSFGNKPWKMCEGLRKQMNRHMVAWCVLDGRPWVMGGDLDFKMLMAPMVPEYAATTPAASTLEKILEDMYIEVKARVIEVLRSHDVELTKSEYSGPFCSLQLDLTTNANQEYCTALVCLLSMGPSRPVRLNLATWLFPGTH